MDNQKLWHQLLGLKSQIDDFSGELSFCYFSENDILINDYPVSTAASGIIISCSSDFQIPAEIPGIKYYGFERIELDPRILADERESHFFKLYLPYCFTNYRARQLERCISIAHFAQSLDGKIATLEGDSRWIGNEENLIHAHRMRALCDGIVVGNNTIRYDQPRLTVRKVEGKNPKRIVIGNSKVDMSSLLASCTDPVLVISNQFSYENKQLEPLLVASVNCKIGSQDVLTALYHKGIRSIYIEGGAKTTSNFLSDKAVDILQLHIAPIVFGSGKQGIVLPDIKTVEESRQFKHFEFFPIGNSVMFVGVL